MSDALPPWRPLLRGARQREGRSPQARWLQLATLGSDGAPRVRTLVFRGWAGACQLDLLTDRRSEKSAELSAEPRLELCWLLPKAKSQFRIRGHRLVLNAADDQSARSQHWQQLHPGARSLWGWPQPGAPFDPLRDFPEALGDAVPLPETFELVRIEIQQVELLELVGHPHRRRRWRLDQDWAEECLNP